MMTFMVSTSMFTSSGFYQFLMLPPGTLITWEPNHLAYCPAPLPEPAKVNQVTNNNRQVKVRKLAQLPVTFANSMKHL
jgi:hypothetical protein